MIDVNSYLGKWLDEDPPKGKDTCIECVNVNEATNMAIFADGQQVKLEVLDLSPDRYSKIKPIYEEPSIAASLGAQSSSISAKATQSAILGDLGKIGNRERNGIAQELRENQEPAYKGVDSAASTEPQYRLPDDPIGIFIESAIKISKKAGKKSVIPISLNLELDFDIIGIIESAMKLGASDIEILQHILNQVNIGQDTIKRLIAEELLKSPEDASIVMEHREEVFENVLTEELEKHSNANPIEGVQIIERYEAEA